MWDRLRGWRTASRVPLSVYLRGAIILIIALVFAVGWAGHRSLGGRSYRVTNADIHAVVTANGSLRADETFTYRFKGVYHGIYRDIPVGAGSAVRVLGVDGPGGPLQELAAPDGAPSSGALGPAGTYTLTTTDSGLRITVYQPETDTSAAFTFHYTVSGAAQRYSDTSVLYWKFIGDGWDVPLDHVAVSIVLPRVTSHEQVKAWAHGPLNGLVTIAPAGTVHLVVDGLPPHTFVEARVLFPQASLARLKAEPGAEAATVVAEESQWAAQANAVRAASAQKARNDRVVRAAATIAIAALALGGLLLWIVLFRRHGREHDPGFSGRYFRDIPADLPPAVVGSLWRMGAERDSDITATLLDLARRGILAIGREGPLDARKPDIRLTLHSNAQHSDAAHLTTIDAGLLDFVFGTAEYGDSISLSELTNWAELNTASFQSAMKAWRQTVRDEVDKQGFLEQSGQKAQLQTLFCGIAVLALSIILGVVSRTWVAPGAGGAVGLFMIVTCTAMKRRTPAAATLHAQYTGLYNYMRDFGRLQEKPPEAVVLWESYLVLAVVFGIAHKVADQMSVRVPEVLADPGFHGTYGWAFAASGFSGHSFSAFSSGFGAAVAAGTPSSSGSSGGGFGGGFSGGGGGGGGGGAF